MSLLFKVVRTVKIYKRRKYKKIIKFRASLIKIYFNISFSLKLYFLYTNMFSIRMAILLRKLEKPGFKMLKQKKWKHLEFRTLKNNSRKINY